MNDFAAQIFKWIWLTLGGVAGYVIGVIKPTFPLMIVAILFILYDAYSAYRLDVRVHKKYPEKRRREAKFNSFCFGKVVRQTIPEMLGLIILAHLAEEFVVVDYNWKLPYVITGVICFWQALSIVENMASCNDSNSMFWKYLKKVLVSKVERHFDEVVDNVFQGKDFDNKEETSHEDID